MQKKEEPEPRQKVPTAGRSNYSCVQGSVNIHHLIK